MTPQCAVGDPVVIFHLTPTNTPERRKAVSRRTHGFTYYVSITDITAAQLTDLTLVKKKWPDYSPTVQETSLSRIWYFNTRASPQRGTIC